MSHNFKIFILIFMMASLGIKSTGALASSWNHINLISSERIKIKLDYQISFVRQNSDIIEFMNTSVSRYFLNPLYVNVDLPNTSKGQGSLIQVIDEQMTPEEFENSLEAKPACVSIRAILINYPMPQPPKRLDGPFVYDLGELKCEPNAHYWSKISYPSLVSPTESQTVFDSAQSAEQMLTVYSESVKGVVFYRQELAVEVDGHWLTDPVSGQHNFKVNFYDVFTRP